MKPKKSPKRKLIDSMVYRKLKKEDRQKRRRELFDKKTNSPRLMLVGEDGIW